MESDDILSTNRQSSGKKYLAPSAFTNVDADGFTTLGGYPWFDIEDLAVDGFVEQHSIDGYLPGDNPL